MNPPQSPAFSDVIYDEIECPMGIESDAIPDYVYFGPMVSTMSVSKHADCLNYCIQNPRCVAVNFFEPMAFQERGFCELLSESQLDNPRLMRPFKQAIYYENIKCRLDDDTQQSELIKIRPASFSRKRLKNASRSQSDPKETVGKSARIQHEVSTQKVNNASTTAITSMRPSTTTRPPPVVWRHQLGLSQDSWSPLRLRRPVHLRVHNRKPFLLRIRPSSPCCKFVLTPMPSSKGLRATSIP
ncbi:Uncharacterized protein Tcan_12595 [Toxocara canis]|nr:Uncharacterized protein Tcan_12595 [Toxocara canis]